MNNISTEILIIILIILFLLSAFFSGSETALMSINKYKMRHQAKLNNKGAKAAKKLLENPDKIIGVILLGNNLTNILITQIATLISLRVYGDIGLAIATGLLTIFILIFAELTPKTIGQMHSEKIAYSSSLLYTLISTSCKVRIEISLDILQYLCHGVSRDSLSLYCFSLILIQLK